MMHSFFFSSRDQRAKVPETKTEEGSSRRNITRKHDHDPHRKDKKQHGGGGGKGKWNDIDDGTMEYLEQRGQ